MQELHLAHSVPRKDSTFKIYDIDDLALINSDMWDKTSKVFFTQDLF